MPGCIGIGPDTGKDWPPIGWSGKMSCPGSTPLCIEPENAGPVSKVLANQDGVAGGVGAGLRDSAGRGADLVLGHDGVQHHGDQRANAVRGGQDDDDRVARELCGARGPAGDERVGGPVRHERHADAQSQGGSDDEAVAAVVDARTKDLEAGHGDVDEEEGRHATEHAVWDCGDDGRDLGEDAEEEEEEGAEVAGAPVCAARERDHAAVLREGGVGHRGAEAREQRADPVSREPALHAPVELIALRLDARGLRRRSHVTDRLDRSDHVRDDEREEGWAVHAQGEGVDPEEGDGRRVLDPIICDKPKVLVRSSRGVGGNSGHEEAEEESQSYLAVAEERRTEDFDDEQRSEYSKAQANVLRRSEWQHHLAVASTLDGRLADVIISGEDARKIHEGLTDGDIPIGHVVVNIILGRGVLADAREGARERDAVAAGTGRFRGIQVPGKVSHDVSPADDLGALVGVVGAERTATPVLDASASEANADEEHADSSDHGRKASLQ
eukprot:3939665-Rhodomonas_salina.1